MTHPVMWAFFNSMTGAALDVPRNKLFLSPRVFPDETSVRIPLFFPKFWATLHYDTTTKKAMIDFYKRHLTRK